MPSYKMLKYTVVLPLDPRTRYVEVTLRSTSLSGHSFLDRDAIIQRAVKKVYGREAIYAYHAIGTPTDSGLNVIACMAPSPNGPGSASPWIEEEANHA